MIIGIHKSNWGFTPDWIKYCQENSLNYKLVDCYSPNIYEQLKDCDALLWHYSQSGAKEVLFAKQLFYSLTYAGLKVFPDFNSNWHFDDKVGQKYLLEAIHAATPKTWVFYEKREAFRWAETFSFPAVFKLRGGAGSNNVRLVKSKFEAKKLIHKAFGKGFPSYNKTVDLKENFRLFEWDKKHITELLKSIRRLFYSTRYAKTIGPQKGYILFQEYIPGNAFDIRIITIGHRAFGIKRLVRDNDFRASGSGRILYRKEEIDQRCVKIAFETTAKMKALCVAYDFVFTPQNNPLIVEINYGFAHQAYFPCPGYWDNNLIWHEEKFNAAHWIVEEIIKSLNNEH